MGRGADHPDPRFQHGAAQIAQDTDRLVNGRADVRDQLNLARVHLAGDLAALDLADSAQDMLAGVDLRAGARVDQEQLLLDTQRERLLGAEARLPKRIVRAAGYSATTRNCSSDWSDAPSRKAPFATISSR
jgi:hypothetical protein